MDTLNEGSDDDAWAKVLDCEHQAIETRRRWLLQQNSESKKKLNAASKVQHTNAKPNKHRVKTGDYDTLGIALSGGGIRSAAFCLGVLQALEVNGLFKTFDYLSTVSGGGYIGTALTSAMSKNGGQFPFIDPQNSMSDSAAVSHIRDFSNYLIPKGFIDFVRDLAIVFRGLVAVVMIVLPVVLFLAVFTLFLNPNAAALYKPPIHFNAFGIGWPIFDNRFAWTQTILMLSPLLFSIWAISRSIQRATSSEFSGWVISAAAFAMLFFGFTAFLELQPFIITYLDRTIEVSGVSVDTTASSKILASSFDGVKNWVIAAGSIVATVSAFARSLIDVVKTTEAETGWKANIANLVSKIVLWIGALALPVFIWLVYLLLVYWGIPDVGKSSAPAMFTSWMCKFAGWFGNSCDVPSVAGNVPPFLTAYLVLAVAVMSAALLLGPNANSLHKLYRDRLGVAFMPPDDEDATRSADMKLSDLDTQKSPYHIINAALNIQGAKDANRRERNADFFHFSKDYAGSRLSKYNPTADVEKENPSLTLASAMAISGAAVSSNMGSASIRALTPTLALLNLRLGYWLRNPAVKSPVSNLFFLFKEMFWRLSNTDKWLYLSDGGHIENSGIYALLKRRCKLIFAVDAEADPQMTFASLARLERYARIDLGCRITIFSQAIIEAHKKATAPGYSPISGSTGPHCAIGEIAYQDGGKGTLIYVKSSLTGDENNYVRDYARRHNSFPHETTSDQFFQEEQFEAYRALGFHATHGLFKTIKPDVVAIPYAPPNVLSTKGNAILQAARVALGLK